MVTIEFDELEELRSGENPNQSAALAKINGGIDYEILHGENYDYVSILNWSIVAEVLAEFFDVDAVAIAKESHICSVALGNSLYNAFDKALDCDPISAYLATIGFTKEIDLDLAKQIVSVKLKNVVAPSFTKNALEYLKNYDVTIVKINSPLQELLGFNEKDIKITPFGALIQDQNNSKLSKDNFKVVTKKKPTQQQAEDAIFAWKVSKHLKSRSAVIVKDLATKAIVQSETSGIFSVEKAIDYACESTKDAVLSLDGVIETKETVNSIIQSRIGLIIESGQGVNNSDIIKIADKYELSMISTGLRNNKY